jgi:hypothetical protein
MDGWDGMSGRMNGMLLRLGSHSCKPVKDKLFLKLSVPFKIIVKILQI